MRYCAILLLLFAFVGCTQKPKTAEQGKPTVQEGKEYVEGEILVKFKPETTDSIINEVNKGFGTSILKKSDYTETYRIKIPEGKSVEEMVELYKKSVYVEFAEPNRIVKISPIEKKGEALKTEEKEEGE